MSRLTLGTLLVLAVLGCSSAIGPLSFIQAIDSSTLTFQNGYFWYNKLNGEPDPTAEETLRRIKDISIKMESFRKYLSDNINLAVNKIISEAGKTDDFKAVVKAAAEQHKIVDSAYKLYTRFVGNKVTKHSARLSTKMWEEHVKEVELAVKRLYNIFVPGRQEDNGLVQIINYLNNNLNERCDKPESPQHWLYDFFSNIIFSEVRAYAFIRNYYSIKIGLIKKPKNQLFYKNQLQYFLDDFHNRNQTYWNIFPEYIAKVNQGIRRCDFPNPKPVRGVDYFEFEKLYQGYMINADQYKFPCPYCDAITSLPGHLVQPPVENGTKYPLYQKCNGEVRDCKSIAHPPVRQLEICLRPESDRRRYDWIYDEQYHEHIYGTNFHTEDVRECKKGTIEKVLPTQHISPGVIGAPHEDLCHYCLCTCAQTNDTTSEAIRAISLRDQKSNAALNRVVVGVRLVQQDNMVHIQIKEGELLQQGFIKNVNDNNTKGWVPLERMNIKEGYLITRDNFTQKIQEDQAYAYIDKYNDTILLDDYIAKDDWAIIGVGFMKIDHHHYHWKAIGLKIKIAPFDWTTGKLDFTRDAWYHPGTIKDLNLWDNENFRNIQENELAADDPTKSLYNQPILERAPIQFHISDFVKDAGQSVWPYFDSQEVVTRPSFPLGGISLFQRGAKGFSGYIAPKIHTAKISEDRMQKSIECIQANGFYNFEA